MTTTAPGHDPLEQLLATALRDARTDARWAVAPPPGMAARVRRTALRQRRQRRLLTVAAGVLALGGATAGLSLLGASGAGPVDVVAGPAPATAAPAEGPTAEPTPVPGIDPAFVPTHGRDWLLSGPDFERFVTTHTTPSPRPNPVQSPAPLTDYSARLLADVEAALPDGATTERQDALNGDPATAGIHVRLADGTPVEVEREPLQTPVPVDDSFHLAGQAPPPPPADIPGSDSVLLAVPHVGYGWGPDFEEGARSVAVVRRDGELTRWSAPLSVPLETVVGWALAAEAAGR